MIDDSPLNCVTRNKCPLPRSLAFPLPSLCVGPPLQLRPAIFLCFARRFLLCSGHYSWQRAFKMKSLDWWPTHQSTRWRHNKHNKAQTRNCKTTWSQRSVNTLHSAKVMKRIRVEKLKVVVKLLKYVKNLWSN